MCRRGVHRRTGSRGPDIPTARRGTSALHQGGRAARRRPCARPASPPALARRALFVVLAAALAAAATHAGLWLSEALGSLGRRAGHELSFHEDVTLAIVLTAALGAVAYGFLVRALWLPRLSRSAPVRIALACIAAMLVMAAALPPEHYLDWFVVLWWFVFSTALWWFCRGRPPDDGPLIEPRG